MDYAVNRKYFIMRLLSPVKYGKKFVNGNIGPRCKIWEFSLMKYIQFCEALFTIADIKQECFSKIVFKCVIFRS